MLDIILIQHVDTGINLLEYEQDHTSFDKNHSDIFSGFLSAIQNITSELNIGTVVLISTEGEKGHNCIIIQKYPINIILLVDQSDPIDLWRETGQDIADRFIEKYGENVDSSYVSQYDDFITVLKDICATNNYCD